MEINDENELFNLLLAKAMLNEEENEDEEEICLISNEKLGKYKITLPCNHSFNYVALYNEILNQKNNWIKIKHISHLETQKLGSYQIKCPYCRNIHNGLIPYIKIDGVKKLKYINHPMSKVIHINSCKYEFKSGKRKGEWCGKNCLNEYCVNHANQLEKKSKNTHLCKHELLRGKRKGELCGKKCSKHNNNYCRNHIPKPNNIAII